MFGKRIIALCALLAMMPHPACAGAQVDISGFADQSPSSWGMGDPDISMHIDLCAYAGSNSPSGGYAVTVTSDSGSFVLKNGSLQLPYSVTWDDGGAGNLGHGTGATVSYNSKLTGQLNANTSSSICFLSNPTARLNIKVLQADLSAALAGTYRGTIYVTLSTN